MINLRHFRKIFEPALLLAVAFAVSGPAVQQAVGSELELLRESEVREELGLSEEAAQKLEAALKITRPGTEFFTPYLKRLDEADKAGDNEAKSAIRKEMFAAQAEKMDEMKSAALEILTENQKRKLRGLYLRSAGMKTFSDSRVAKAFGITEEQQKEFNELSSEYRRAARSLGDASEEDRDKFGEDWKAKFLAVMTDVQRQQFVTESAYGQTGAPVSAVAGSGNSDGETPSMNQAPAGAEVVGTFGGGQPGESSRVTEFKFNFRYETWERVLKMYADGAGLTLDLNQIPPGTFSHYDDNSYTARQTLDILNGYLHRKGFAMIENDGFLIVMNTDNGIPPYLIRDVTEEQLLKVGKELEVGNNELATLRISIDGMETATVAQEVEALLGPLGSMVALTNSELLIITDVGANLRRIHGFLTAAMSKAKPDALIFEAYFLKNMDAEEAEIAVMTQFGMRQNVANVSVSVEQSRSRTRGGAPPTPTPAKASEDEPAIQIASDLRLNSLLVTGTAKQHELVKTILTALDVSEGPDGAPLMRGRKGTYLEVYQVKSADAGEVTKTLGAMNIPGVQVVNEDRKTGRVHIMATERQHQEVAALIRQLDGSGVSGSVSVIQLAQMDPLSAAATLRSLFYADGDDAPTIETDLYGRRLIVRGSIDQITQIKQVLADLGEDGTGVRDRGDGGLVRRFSLQGRNPEEFLKVLQNQWDAQQQETKINIVIPNETGPVRSRRTTDEEFDRPGDAEPQPAGDPVSQRRFDSPARRLASGRERRWNEWKQPHNLVTATALSPDEPATGASQAADKVQADPERSWSPENRAAGGRSPVQPGNRDSEIFIQLLGDELILSASDESKLDELEDLLDFLHQSLPMKPEYTVVYLKAADALEAADMLSQFFPSSSVSTTSLSSGMGGSLLGDLGGSLGGMGSSLMDMTGISGLGVSSSTLKIIPDIRTNSLFMTGPPSMIRDALAFLKVLDSNDIPESLKDMQPRQIVVSHAEVNDVASMLREVFKPYMEAQGGGKQGQQNPLAMMFGGGASGGRGGNEATQVRMTMGVDSQTSTLTINSSQEIFDEVQSVVQSTDDAAKAARPMVLPIQLRHADATVIQQMLSSLVPRVSVTTSRTNSSSTSNSGSNNGGDNGRNSSNNDAQKAQEAAAREFQNRIRERMQQQSGGGNGGGGQRGGGRAAGGGRPGGRGR